MKTINEIARNLGISKQTFYNVVKRKGILLDDLTIEWRGKTRYLNDQAEDIVKDALSKDNVKVDVKRKAEFDNVDNECVRAELDKAHKRIADQAEELEKLKAELEKLKEDNSILIRTNATNAVTIQKLQAEKDQALLTSGDDRARGGIWQGIRRLFNSHHRDS